MSSRAAQSRCLPLAGKLAALVTPLMAEETVVVVVGVRAGRDHDRRPSTGPQDTGDLPQRATIVGHVLEQVRRQHRIDARIRERNVAGVSPQQPRSRHMLVGLDQPGADEVEADSVADGYRLTDPPAVAGRATEVENHVVRTNRRAVEHRSAGPHVHEVASARFLVQLLELVRPVDLGTIRNVGEERRSPLTVDQPAPVVGRHRVRTSRWAHGERFHRHRHVGEGSQRRPASESDELA